MGWAKGSARREVVAAIASMNKKEVVEFQGDASLFEDSHYLSSIATVCWLRDTYLFLSREMTAPEGGKHSPDRPVLPSQTIPANFFLAMTDRDQLAQLRVSSLLPMVHVPPTTYEERVRFWKKQSDWKATIRSWKRLIPSKEQSG